MLSMSKRIFVFFAIAVCTVFCFMSCKSSVKASALSNGDIELNVYIDLGEELSSAIVSLTGLTGDEEAVIFNTSEMEESLVQSGFISPKVKSTAKDCAQVSVIIKKDTFSSIIFNNDEELTIKFNPQSINELIAFLGEDYLSYVSLLMAPVLTGEESSAQEYKSLLAAVYGDELAEEVTGGIIDFTLNGRKGRCKRYTVDLVDLLTLKADVSYSVSNR